jgi:mannose-6-phosphate isomerase-like protein (cupin superfamily)
MSELFNQLAMVSNDQLITKEQIVEDIRNKIESNGYTITELDSQRPWGAYFRFSDSSAGQFIEDFFPDLSLSQAKMGNDKAELSPKILLVMPEQRLSWQYHNRRAERWSFLTNGAYEKSLTNTESPVQIAHSGDSVQIVAQERHRLIGAPTAYTIVAEIWQHTDSNNLSDENDNYRLQDDYGR